MGTNLSYGEFVKRLLTVVALAIGLIGFWYLRQIIMLAFLSAVIAISLNVPVSRLVKSGMQRPMAIAITVVAVVSTIALFLAIILPAMVSDVSTLAEQLPDAFEQVQVDYQAWYDDQDVNVSNLLPELNDIDLEQLTVDATDALSPLLADAGSAVLGVVGNILFVTLVAIFLLLDPKDYVRGVIFLMPPDYRERTLEVMVQLRASLTAWLTALTFSITITTFLVWFALGIFWNVPNSLALGVIAGLMTIIPNIGSVVPLIPIAIFTLADDPVKLPFVIATYFAIQMTESNILTPSIVKRQMNIPAALTFFFQLISAVLFGFIGILMAVPLLATIITLVRELYVYDTLGQRGVEVDIANDGPDVVRLVTSMPGTAGEERKVLTQTFQAIGPRMMPPPEDIAKSPEDLQTKDGKE